MKKQFALLFIIPLLLTSCINEDKSIYYFHNIDITNETTDGFIYPNANQISAMIDSRHQFPLYIYKQDCGHCAVVSTLLNKYIREKKVNFYAIDSASNDFTILKNKYPNMFYNGLSTPQIYIYKYDRYSAISSSVMEEESALFRTLNQYLYNVNFNTVYNNLTAFEQYLNKDNYLLINLPSEVEETYTFIDVLSLAGALSSNNDTTLIFYDLISQPIKEKLSTLFDNDYEQHALIKSNGTSITYDLVDELGDFILALADYY